jgi:mannose/fructose/N-acetylgalactosamine-specific phosphotransferase system component IIC
MKLCEYGVDYAVMMSYLHWYRMMTLFLLGFILSFVTNLNGSFSNRDVTITLQ